MSSPLPDSYSLLSDGALQTKYGNMQGNVDLLWKPCLSRPRLEAGGHRPGCLVGGGRAQQSLRTIADVDFNGGRKRTNAICRKILSFAGTVLGAP